MSGPEHGDGRTYTGVCLCCGVDASGTVARSRPAPYEASADPFGGGPRIRVILVTGERGVHEIPVPRK